MFSVRLRRFSFRSAWIACVVLAAFGLAGADRAWALHGFGSAPDTAATGDWFDPSIWSTSVLPTSSSDEAIIAQGAVVTAGRAAEANIVTVQAGGTLIVTGAGSVTSDNYFKIAGTLEVNGSAAVVAPGDASRYMEIQQGGVLRGTGTLDSSLFYLQVDNGGTLAAGTASTPGQLTINTDLTLQTGSTVALRVNGASHDTIVAGNVTIQSGTTLLLTGGGLVGGQTVSLFQTSGTLTGSFDTVTSSLNNALGFQVNVVGSNINVTTVQNSFATFAQNPNQAAVATVLNRVAGDSREAALIGALNALPGASLPAAFTQLSPIQEAAVVQTSVQASHAAFNTLSNRMSNVRSGSTGLALNQFNWLDQNIPGSALIAGTGLPTGIQAFRPAPENRWGFFAAANGNFGDIDGQTVQSSYHGAGFTAGADYRVDNAFAVGFAAAYDYSKTDFDHSGSNSTANTVRFGPYATWHDRGGDWVDGTLGGAVHFYDSNRQVLGDMAASDATGTEFDTTLKYGHDFRVKAWTLTPTLGFDYLHLAVGKYTETGSLAPLTVQDQSIDSFRSNLGGAVAYGFKWKGVGWNPYVQAGWAHEFLDASQTVNARFASGAGDVFAATGDNLGHDSATFGLGLQAALTDSLTANLSYAGEANDRYQDHSFNAAVRVGF